MYSVVAFAMSYMQYVKQTEEEKLTLLLFVISILASAWAAGRTTLQELSKDFGNIYRK